ncbi:MAG: T9SS type A sorting domain-containing protein, partial [Bacteroidia bacterium]|nr:T9SS type A sorting domain-containing protein [Bacteroidia bacterium]
VDDGANTGSMHTSCSQDILGQTFGGSFTVVAHIDMNNETSTVADCPDGVDRLVVNANANAYADLNTTEDSEAVINTEQSKNITEAKVYPNPTTGRITFDLTVDTNATERLLIYNSQGQIIVDRNINLVSGFNSNKIDLSDYHSGLYYIRLGDLPVKRILVTQ